MQQGAPAAQAALTAQAQIYNQLIRQSEMRAYISDFAFWLFVVCMIPFSSCFLRRGSAW